MPISPPDVNWMMLSHIDWELPSRVLHREGTWSEYVVWSERAKANPAVFRKSPTQFTPTEQDMQPIWENITILAVQIGLPKSQEGVGKLDTGDLVIEIDTIRKAMEKLRMPGSTALALEDEPTLFHENMLMACFHLLEVLRAVSKLVDLIREAVINAKAPHPLKSKFPKAWVDDLARVTQICYQAIRDVAESYILLIRKRGQAIIEAQVRWGKTGARLAQLLTAEDVEYYANEYVESALEAWNGVLKVKLK